MNTSENDKQAVVPVKNEEAKPSEESKPPIVPPPIPKAPTPEDDDETKAKADTKSDTQEKGGANGKTVLIVEDTVELAEVLQATLERMGVTALSESHAAKALEIFKEKRPDLILLDIGLPDMSGWKLLDGIKELDKDNRPHFVVITAYGDPANRLMGKLQDVDSYLIKPFSPDEVERVVGKVLGVAS